MKRLGTLRAAFGTVRRHPGLVAVFYLVGLVPALLLVSVLASTASPALDRSLEADRILEGEWAPVWFDALAADQADHEIVLRLVPLRWLLTALLGIFVAAGAVELLLDRRRTNARTAFSTGIARHGGRFLRSALWFALTLVPVVLIVGAGGAAGREIGSSIQDDRIGFAVQLLGLLVALLLFAWLDLGYDLSRLAAARHDDRRTFKGYLRALGAVLRRPLVIFFLWGPLFLMAIGPAVAYVWLRQHWLVSTGAEIVLLLVVQQLVFVLQAASKTALWGGEITWYEAHGAPRWCASRPPGQSVTAMSRTTAGRQEPASQAW